MSDPREPVDGGGAPSADDDNLDIDIDDIDTGEEPEAEPEPVEDVGYEPEPEPRRQSRRDRQTAHWRDQYHEAERRNQEYERRLAALEGGQRQPQVDPRQQQQQLLEQLDQIADSDPRTMVRSIYGLLNQQMQQGLNATNLQNTERADLSAWNSIQRDEPHARRLASQVEQQVQTLRNQGIYNISREVIYERVLGQQIREQARTRAERQGREAGRRVARQTTRPLNGRGDIARGSAAQRNQDAADLDILRNTTVGDI